MSLTPTTNDGKWQLTQKSYLTANNVTSNSNLKVAAADEEEEKIQHNLINSRANNRTTNSDNPAILNNRLVGPVPLGTINTTRVVPAPTANVRNHHHNRSLQRDPELESAMEVSDTVQRVVTFPTLEDSKGSGTADD